MTTDPLMNVELPKSVRDLVKASIEQAKQAFDTFVSTNDKTWKSLENSSLATTMSLRALNEKIADITRKNADANFQLAIELSESKDMAEALELQNLHARKQMETFSSQLEEIRDLAVNIVLDANAASNSLAGQTGVPSPPSGQQAPQQHGSLPQSAPPPNRAPQSGAPGGPMTGAPGGMPSAPKAPHSEPMADMGNPHNDRRDDQRPL